MFEDSRNVYIILELCTNKTLSEMVKKRKILEKLKEKYYEKFLGEEQVINQQELDEIAGNLFFSSAGGL